MSKVQYTESGLIITIPVADPAAEHAALMQSIVATIARSHDVNNEAAPLYNLLRVILPDERTLETGNC